MKGVLLASAVLAATLTSTHAVADDDCYEPVTDWQPKSQLRDMLQARGWQVKRIKVDDGCYEVEGINDKGKRVEATFSPSSLHLLGNEYDDEDDNEENEKHESGK